MSSSSSDHSDRLIVALDFDSVFKASQLAERVLPHVGLFKVGLELFMAVGPRGIKSLALPLMLDLKLHDIPKTVANTVRAAYPLAPQFMTVHAQGGREMILAARKTSEEAGEARPKIIAVTILTSLDQEDLRKLGLIRPVKPFKMPDVSSVVSRLAILAIEAGADGLVCSPQEVAMLRAELGPDVILITPGIRPKGSSVDDQARVATPAEAVSNGADYVVVGRPITEAEHPAVAAAAIARELNEGARGAE